MCNLGSALVQMGEQRGEQRGEMNKAKETAFNLKEMGMSEENIAKAVNVSVALIKRWLGGAMAQ